jgi:hypothetical protein
MSSNNPEPRKAAVSIKPVFWRSRSFFPFALNSSTQPGKVSHAAFGIT